MQRFWGLAMVLVCLPLGAEVADPGPAARARPDETSRCPVCGMLVAPHADWLAQIVFEDETALFFDGAKDLFRFLVDPQRYGGMPGPESGAALFVTSYYDRERIAARDALYVIGSDVRGPMGPELIPHPDLASAEEFLRDHQGAAIVRFGEVTGELLEGLR